jgi:hypothetical protein
VINNCKVKLEKVLQEVEQELTYLKW